MPIPEYDVVAFDPAEGRWRSHLPPQREKDWSRRLPLAWIPRTYAGITTGSERTLMRGPNDQAGGVARPDLNMVFDQVAYHPPSRSLIYFTGGLTAAYEVAARRWRDLAPAQSPPPVLAGSLEYDPIHDELVLFGGGHVAERAPDGRLAGYTGTWTYRPRDNQWRRLPALILPPPRMNTRMVCDRRNQVLVLFGGDGQSRYLADTWLFDLARREWRPSRATGGPEARAGHVTVYDPETGWVIIGGGYNRTDLTDMWAYDAAEDRWRRLPGQVPAGFYLSADIAPEKRLILLVTATRKPGDRMSCNILYPVRTTYGYQIEGRPAGAGEVLGQQPAGKRRPPEAAATSPPQRVVFPNQWVQLAGAGQARTWGSATLDAARGQILYWGGGHCGYEGNDVDVYDIETQSWRPGPSAEFPQRAWERGARLAGVTFDGAPWTEHGRKIYAHDPVSRKMILVRPVRLTTGYEPEALREAGARAAPAPDAIATPPSSYTRYYTWSWDPETSRWEPLGGAPAGLDTLVTTRHGVMGVNVEWPSRLNDAGYHLPWSSLQPARDTAAYLFDAGRREWKRLDQPQPSPQNLYEMTALAWDSRRDQLILHGGGARRDELWTFDLTTKRWRHMQPQGPWPVATREGVYVASEDVFLIYGPAPEDRTLPALWAYKPGENRWRRVDMAPMTGIEPERRANQNRAMVYDAERDLVLLVLGAGGDAGRALVYALRFRSGLGG